METTVSIDNEDQLQEWCTQWVAEFGERIAKEGMCVGLIGCLGAGKTTLVRYLAEALEISQTVSSPTYVLQNQYVSSTFVLDHWDLYRLGAVPGELSDPVVRGELRCIEWINKFSHDAVDVDVIIEIAIESADRRRIDMQIIGS